MKQKLPVIFAFISFLILGALIVAGIAAPGNKTEKSSRLFSNAAAGDTPAADKNQDAISPSVDRKPEAVSENSRDESKDSDEAYEASSDEAAVSGNGNDKETVSGSEVREPLEKYRDYLDINPYLAGWLSVEDSVINDPVVYTPKSQNYFLHRNLDGTETANGTLFIAVVWREGYNNTLIYGHNMKDGSSFGSLKKYADEAYGKSHPIIRFDTLYEDREYELLAAFYSQIDEEELETEEDREEADRKIEEESIAKKEEKGETVEGGLTIGDLDLYEDYGDIDVYRQEKDEDNGRFRYYYYTDLSDKKDFDYFVEHVKMNALYDTGVEAEWGDELLTLSTCSYHVPNGRFIVVAKRKK
ncbi:MAG: class B sortase [Lachnospiraceae bacterium]|nr:class B sortase [Lachnospiraceae bacterium]